MIENGGEGKRPILTVEGDQLVFSWLKNDVEVWLIKGCIQGAIGAA